MGRLLTETLPDPDGAGPLAAPVMTYTYAADGRLQSVEDFAGQLVSYVDNAAGLLNQYQYDYLNRITRITQAGGSGGNAVAEKRVDFDYDLEFKNRFAEITRYADLAGSETVAVSSYDYDFAGRLTGIDHRDSASVLLAGYSLSYDEANRLAEFLVAGHSAEDAVYSYDDTDRLIGVDRDGTSNDESYTYDENGNRIGGGYSGGANNQLLSDGTFNYTYDDEGNRLTKTNIATGETAEYSWDHRNRLTAIVTKDDLGVITHEVQYTYDIFNRRILKTIDADGAGPGAATQEIYIYDGLREERGHAGDHILLRFDESENLTGRYLHGPNVDQILAGEDVTGPTVEGDVLWALTDHLGTVRDLAEYDAVTGDTSIVNHIVYDAFGRIVSETDSTIQFLYGFTGRERDSESDLQYNRARYYDAALGRWLSEDPIGFEAGDENLYRYVGNEPTTLMDPSGLRGFWSNYWHYLTNPREMDRDLQIAQSASFGVAAGAGSAAVVLVAAPAAASAGGMCLWGAGYSATTSVTVASGGVTAGLGVTAIYGGYNLTVSSINAYNESDWNQLAYNGGMVVGGAIGIPGSRPCLSNSFPGTSTSNAPPLWNVPGTIRYELGLGYNPQLGPPGLAWLATGPTPASGAGVLVLSPGILIEPQVLDFSQISEE